MNFIYSLVITLFFLQTGLSQITKVPTGKRIRDIVEVTFKNGNVLIGATTGAWAFDTRNGDILDREFNYVTPENDFKQWNIHPDNNKNWNWKETDLWVKHIKQNNQILRMHCPIGPQCSSWAKNDSRTGDELKENLHAFMTAVCKRYNNVSGIEYMDVVNEIAIKGKWHKNKKGTDWENPWFIMGQDTDKNKTPLFIRESFEIATKETKNIKLILNHHEGPEEKESWDLIKETVLYLRNLGYRIDGIGWQAHVDLGWDTPENINSLDELITWSHQNNLEFLVTEASVWIKNENHETHLEKQAETYVSILDVLLKHRNSGKVSWNTWHIDDGHGWNTKWLPSLFDSEYRAKPAYYKIQSTLESIK